jgi:hypothetical protein
MKPVYRLVRGLGRGSIGVLKSLQFMVEMGITGVVWHTNLSCSSLKTVGERRWIFIDCGASGVSDTSPPPDLSKNNKILSVRK